MILQNSFRECVSTKVGLVSLKLFCLQPKHEMWHFMSGPSTCTHKPKFINITYHMWHSLINFLLLLSFFSSSFLPPYFILFKDLVMIHWIEFISSKGLRPTVWKTAVDPRFSLFLFSFLSGFFFLARVGRILSKNQTDGNKISIINTCVLAPCMVTRCIMNWGSWLLQHCVLCA